MTKRAFINVFSKMAAGFHRQTKQFELNFFVRKTIHYSVDGQIGWAKSSSQPVKLPDENVIWFYQLV